MKSSHLERLRIQLNDLKTTSGLVAIKTGTEVEDMSFPEIRILRALCREILPLYVKIGGPEARNDMRELAEIGVDCVISPMIESKYALKKFVESMKVIYGSAYSSVEKGINLETITAFQHMNEILSCPEFQEMDQVTAARSDLSGSLDLPADDDRVMEICSVIVARCREYDLRTSVGGNIHPGIIERIIDEIQPDTVNTRHMVLYSKGVRPHAAESLQKAMLFECDLCRFLSVSPGPRQSAYKARAKVLEERLSQKVTA